MKTKASILIFLIALLCVSCKEAGTKANDNNPEKIVGDTVQNEPAIQKSKIAADTTGAKNESPNVSSGNDISLLAGSWDDVDPNDPGPGSQNMSFTADGHCDIFEQEGGYKGNWFYDPATGILNLKLSHWNGSGVIDQELDKKYQIEELTEYKITISDIQDGYPKLGGSFWKSQN
ncbi:MAG: hypothetical protein ACJ75J_12015 [Cytophagaceae bacterium]